MYLPRLLKWDDRNWMAFSIEGRCPFLDHELIELCLSFAPEILYHRGWTKWPLRYGLREKLPEKVAFRRSKFGFWVPQDLWVCGPLRPTLTQWLYSDRPLWDSVDRAAVRRLAEESWKISGRRDEPGKPSFVASCWISGWRSSMSPSVELEPHSDGSDWCSRAMRKRRSPSNGLRTTIKRMRRRPDAISRPGKTAVSEGDSHVPATMFFALTAFLLLVRFCPRFL